MIGFLFAGVTNFASYWFSDKLVLRMYGAKEVGSAPTPSLQAAARTTRPLPQRKEFSRC
jgi:heat shock protein HtpX